MRNVKFVDEAMAAELTEVMTGEHANAVKALVYESVNSGFKRGVIYCLFAVAASTVVGASAIGLSKNIISKYQKA